MSSWAAKQLSEMTLEQKVGQLLVSRASVKDVDALVSEGIVGGLYVSNDVPAERIKELKALAATPLLIAQDLEAGYTSGSLKWSSAMSLAAVGDERLAYDWAYMHGLEARRAGVNAVFGPVLDIAMNRQGELCGIRTLGSDPRQAAQLAAAVVSGYQAAGLLPFAKHFPGFGRGIQDAHIELSELNADRATMWEEDLLPYRIAIDKSNLMGVMTGHISVPSINPDVPLPMSRRIMQLLDDIGFRGLAITEGDTHPLYD
jgi:beta-N-acetylhexosaminidase